VCDTSQSRGQSRHFAPLTGRVCTTNRAHRTNSVRLPLRCCALRGVPWEGGTGNTTDVQECEGADGGVFSRATTLPGSRARAHTSYESTWKTCRSPMPPSL
jgi:hypothetical protein